jgi:hypothetical protein
VGTLARSFTGRPSADKAKVDLQSAQFENRFIP